MCLRIYDRLQTYTLQNRASCLQNIRLHMYLRSYKGKKKQKSNIFIRNTLYIKGIGSFITYKDSNKNNHS
ncbi:hypothetical protein Hanom_Chr11g01036671 [Helianthus anomalus]